MGAGIAHIGDAHGTACGTGTSTDFGTWVWVDHGGGVVSKYGHPGSIAVHEGQQVYPTTELGTVGNTGNATKGDCAMNYVDFQVRHGGIKGPTFGKLTHGHRYRVRLWFHTANGWSSPSGWATATAK
jgi:hypothetical protein